MLLAVVTAFEKVVELGEQLCQGGETLGHLFGTFFAMRAAFAVRCSLPIGEDDLPEIAADGENDGSGSTYAKQHIDEEFSNWIRSRASLRRRHRLPVGSDVCHQSRPEMSPPQMWGLAAWDGADLSQDSMLLPLLHASGAWGRKG